MAERLTTANRLMEKISLFARQLAHWDKRIIEVVAIDNMATGTLCIEDVIQLVCTLHPEPVDEHQGFVTTFNLLIKDDHEHVSEQLGIEHPIDLGFKMRGRVYMPDGKILKALDQQVTVWSQKDGG